MTVDEPAGTVDLTALLTRQGTAAWQAIDELVEKSDIQQWALVGGMMVMVQATRYGVAPSRTTNDADVVVDIRVFGRESMLAMAELLTHMEFEVETSPDGVTRYVRGDAKIDLLAPEGTGSTPVETSPPGHAVAAPGSTQALTRTELLQVVWSSGRATSVRIPSVLGAIVAKAAAATEIPSLTKHERQKHISDMVLLLEVAATHTDINEVMSQLSKKDRKRLSLATSKLDDYEWPTLDQERVVTAFVGDLLRG